MVAVNKFDSTGSLVGDCELSDAVFKARILPQALQESVLMKLSNARQAHPKTKNRSEVRGGGRKPWRQKGTGRARQGSIRAPHWRGGAVTMGPDGRSYTQRLPRKVRKGALRSVLTQKVREGKLAVIESVSYEAPKTKQVRDLLDKLGALGERVVFVLPERPQAVAGDPTSEAAREAALNFERSARNLPNVTALLMSNVNTHELLKAERVFLFEGAARRLEEVLSR